MRYLDPKNDLTFKKIFGQHPDLLMSFLNALMPLSPGQEIIQVEYLPAELVPEIPEFKNSIVDVRCIDNQGRQFIVEMQMLWTPSFKYRVLFNASKAYIKQLDKGRKFESLQPVYALNLINDVFLENDPDFYHYYSIVNVEKPAHKLEGLEFVFIELPKFRIDKMQDKKMAVLWLRFLTELKDGDETVSQDLKNNASINKALEILNESAFTKEELYFYDRYWDGISKERTYAYEKAKLASEEARIKGLEEGKREGLEQGLEQGKLQEKIQGIRKAIQRGKLTMNEIAEDFGVSVDMVKEIRDKS